MLIDTECKVELLVSCPEDIEQDAVVEFFDYTDFDENKKYMGISIESTMNEDSFIHILFDKRSAIRLRAMLSIFIEEGQIF